MHVTLRVVVVVVVRLRWLGRLRRTQHVHLRVVVVMVVRQRWLGWLRLGWLRLRLPLVLLWLWLLLLLLLLPLVLLLLLLPLLLLLKRRRRHIHWLRRGRIRRRSESWNSRSLPGRGPCAGIEVVLEARVGIVVRYPALR